MITEVTGDLLADDAHALVNPVNCVGVMGKGLALQFKKAFPEVFEVYAEACKYHEVQPGRVLAVEAGDRWVLNFPTKRHWRDTSWLADIELGLNHLVYLLGYLRIKSVAIPPLGCGLGGLSWEEDVRPLVYDRLGRFIPVDIRLYVPAA